MHYYKRHLGDYAKKAGHLSPLEHGVYTLILDSYYDRECAPTLAEANRWARARTDSEKEAVLAVLSEFFTLDGDVYRQNRVEEELAAYRDKAEINRGIAVERERRKKERRSNDPAKIVQPDVHESCTDRAPESHEDSTIGQPNQEPLTTNHKPNKVKTIAPSVDDATLFPGVSSVVINDFKAHRKAKKAPISMTAMQGITREAEKAGISLEDAMTICCTRGWTGFKAEWITQTSPSKVVSPVSRHAGFEKLDYLEGVDDGRF